jgi:catechol 2,3-dioxygenase-like lactoylglutathione lyase family enzyme
MSVDLFAVISVTDYAAARAWYERLLGSEPSFVAHDTECVWEVGEHGFLAVNEDPGRAGHTVVTMFVEDLEAVVSDVASRGIEPAKRETYSNGVRKTTYRDADGNEIGYGGPPED